MMPSLRSWLRAHAGRYLSILVGVLLLVGAIAWMSGVFHSKIEPGVVQVESPSAASRDLATVELLPTAETIDVVGTVEARIKTQVASQLLATIRDVKVRAGDTVTPGQTLVVLDDREIQAQLGESQAAETGAQANLDVRRGDYQRYQTMLKGDAVTKEEFDRVQGAYKAAEAQVKQIRQQIARTKVMLTHAEIKADASGIVANRDVDPGDLASPGRTLLTLYDPKKRELHASVPESLMADVKLGARLRVRVDAVESQWEGVVCEIVPQAQQASRAVLVKVALPPEAADRLLVGMFGRLSLPIGKTELIVVPTAAVRHVGQVDLVEVVDRDKNLERRFVRTGEVHGDKIEILAGLNVGEQVALPR